MRSLIYAVVLAIFPIYTTATCCRKTVETPKRDYANKIGMLCVHKSEESVDDYEPVSFFIEVGLGENITDHLRLLGTNRKILYFIFGYSNNFKPNKDGDEKLYDFTCMLAGWRQNKETVVCGFDFAHSGSRNPLKYIADYRTVVRKRVPFAAEIIASVTEQMFRVKVFNSFQNIQLIAFSLGSHIAGFVGRIMKEKFKMEISRIFALDPPRTFVRNNATQLRRDDAKYVQAVFSSRLGLRNIEAHCKIILNDGISQPDCNHYEIIRQTFCNHNYLFKLYNGIASNLFNVIAHKDPKADENLNENTPDEMLVGHFSTQNVCGIFYANTTEIDYDEEKIMRGPNASAIDQYYFIDSDDSENTVEE